jgi:hypothetical protein
VTQTNNRFGRAIFLAVLIVLLVGCGPADLGNDSSSNAPESGQASIPAEAEEIVSMVKLDLAEQLGVAVDEVEVVSAEPVDWPDSSLGCPKPDHMYAQTITPGFQIVLASGGEQFVYHTGTNHFVWCDAATAIEAPDQETRVDAQTAALAAQAEQDLSQRLGIAAEEISLVTIESVDWPDASLGCPEPGKMYAQVITPGHRFILAAKGQEYAYHANAEKTVFCEH